MMDRVLYGWYSAKAEEICGSNFWLTPEGTEVLITTVLPEGQIYGWDDKIPLGVVVRWSRSAVKGSLAFESSLKRDFE